MSMESAAQTPHGVESALADVYAIGEAERRLDSALASLTPNEREDHARTLAREFAVQDSESPHRSAITWLLKRIDQIDMAHDRQRQHHVLAVFEDELNKEI